MGTVPDILEPPNENPHPGFFGVPYESITLTASDGITLSAWFIPQSASDKVIIGLHGYPADKGDILPVLISLHDEFNLLFLDFRYFGQSEGAYTTVGAHEVKDLLAAIEFLKARGFRRIGVWGFSLGGAVALMALAETDSIHVVVSESSYAKLSWMARESYRYLFILKYPMAWMTGLWSWLFLGVDMNAVSPVQKVENSRIPILLIHSTTDHVIPFDHALALKEALAGNPNAEIWFQEGLIHGQLGGAYEQRIRTFFRDQL